MKIVYVGLRNIMGIKELEFAPGDITVIDGKNAKGKTSVLKGIQAGIGGGHDATLLTEGEKQGEVVLVFDDGMRLEKEIKRGKSRVTLKDSDGKAIPRAASFLKEIVDELGANPIKILTASSKERVKLLLDSIDMKTPFKEIEKATGVKIDKQDARHPMEIIDEYRASFYGDRTDSNRYIKEKETLVTQMREGLPFKAADTDYDTEIKAMAEEGETLEGEILEVERVSREFIENIKEELAQKKQAAVIKAEKDYSRGLEEARESAQKDITVVQNKHNPRLKELHTEITRMKTNQEETVRVAGSIKYVKDGEKEIRKIQGEIEGFTNVIENLDAIKAKLLENIPINGMSIREGEIYLDGVPFDNVNKAARIRFALTIAGMRQAELPVVCVDNLEALDKESFEIFQDQASKTNMQFFVTRVSNSKELTVSTDDEFRLE